MNDPEIIILLKDLESDLVERKASFSDREKVRQAVCAFANDLPNHQKPGVIFIGVNDDGTCANLSITDELLRTLSDIRSDGNILPFPTLTVGKRVLEGCELAVVIVQPSYTPPVRYKGRVWIRVGPRRAVATQEEELRLAEKRKARDLPYNIQPVNGATLDDLNLDLFNRVYLPSSISLEDLEENQRPVEQQLASLRFTIPKPPYIPTVLGILVVGKDPQAFIGGAYIQFARYDGVELTHPIKDEKILTGPLYDQLRFLDEVLKINIATSLEMDSGLAAEHPDYPLEALQQLARNAVLHRTYQGTNSPVRIYWFSDRIEIISPGGPFGLVNRDNFGLPGVTDYRNPHLAEAMKNLGFVQKFGLGLQIARRQLKKNGNPPPEFSVEETIILATVRKRP